MACIAFLMGGTGAFILVCEADSFPSDEQGHVRLCSSGVCELIMTLGSLCADRWACVPVLFVVWCEGSCTDSCWHLGGARSWIQIEAFVRALSD